VSHSNRGLHSVLAASPVYRASQVILGQPARHRVFVEKYIRPTSGMRVLDVGCGPGDMLSLMPDTDYVGFDMNPRYIERAQRRFAGQAEFHCSDVTEAGVGDRTFDVVTAHALIHHLDDAQADALLALAASVLADGGRFLAADPTEESAPRLARWLVRNDRGRAVRSSDEYAELARRWFDDVSPSREGRPIVPGLKATTYPMVMLECRTPTVPASSLQASRAT
jgi:SAM-dependent methyltransferase